MTKIKDSEVRTDAPSMEKPLPGMEQVIIGKEYHPP